MQIANETIAIIIASLNTLEIKPNDGGCGVRKLINRKLFYYREEILDIIYPRPIVLTIFTL